MRLILAVITAALAGGCSSFPWEGEPRALRPSMTGAAHEPSRSQEVALHALRFIGVPYRYGGVSPATGFDCSGFVWWVFHQAAGVTLPRESRAISQVGQPVVREELQPGDLVFFNTLRRPFSHVGIYLGGQRFVHAPARGGEVEIVNMASRYWRIRYDGARRIIF